MRALTRAELSRLGDELGLDAIGAALASVLRDAGKGGWGNAAIIASAAIGAVLLARIMLRGALSYSIAGSGNDEITVPSTTFCGW